MIIASLVSKVVGLYNLVQFSHIIASSISKFCEGHAAMILTQTAQHLEIKLLIAGSLSILNLFFNLMGSRGIFFSLLTLYAVVSLTHYLSCCLWQTLGMFAAHILKHLIFLFEAFNFYTVSGNTPSVMIEPAVDEDAQSSLPSLDEHLVQDENSSLGKRRYSSIIRLVADMLPLFMPIKIHFFFASSYLLLALFLKKKKKSIPFDGGTVAAVIGLDE
ncbi:hypothetical protein ACJX0J_017189 [Zea mays]